MKVALAALGLAVCLSGPGPASASAGEQAPLPGGFVFLHDIAPEIAQDIRYATTRNFTGRILPGYKAAECVLTEKAARALAKVQLDLNRDGLGLKVFDCYRPARAVRAFVNWTRKPADRQQRRAYHPDLEKFALIPRYIAKRSGHSRGSAVDLTLVLQEGKNSQPPLRPVTCQAHNAEGELDMGTPFDCFDRLSRTAAPGLDANHRKNRQRLKRAMARHGFRNYPGEWWHFSFRPEPFPKRYFDFPIPVRAKQSSQ